MKLDIGLRILALLALVAASTVAIVQPDLLPGASAAQSPSLNSVLPVGRT